MSKIDEFVSAMDYMVNNSNEESDLSVTLVVQGILITGTVVSRDTYINSSDSVKDIHKFIDNSFWSSESRKKLPNKDEDFIHLSNAHYISGGVFFPTKREDAEGINIRVRLLDVSAFSFGEFQLSKASQ